MEFADFLLDSELHARRGSAAGREERGVGESSKLNERVNGKVA